jgi:hypothetical protein
MRPMPFNLFRRGDRSASGGDPETGASEPVTYAPGTIAFEALTEEWRLRGTFAADRRLADVLNRREAIPIRDVFWAPADGSEPFSAVPGLQSVDPYDLIVVILRGADRSTTQDPAEAAAHRLHKVDYDVALDCTPYRVVGTVHLFPGSEPSRIMERQTELFVAVTEPLFFYGGEEIPSEAAEVALVNRTYLRGVEQIDRKTLARVKPLPGRPMGGTSFRSE